MKIIDIRRFNIAQYKKYFDNELKIMSKLNHENIIHLYTYMKTDSHYFLVTEYCNGGNLAQLLKKYNKPFPQDLIQYFMKQIVEGIKYIHSLKIIHRDIKLENILISYRDKNCEFNDLVGSKIKIIDFGLSKEINSSNDLESSFAMHYNNLDPVILEKYSKAGGFFEIKSSNNKKDIQSLGSILYEMITGEKLINNMIFSGFYGKIRPKEYQLNLKLDLSNEIINFLTLMLQNNPDNIASAEELLKSDFLTKNINNFSSFDINLFPFVKKDNKVIIDLNTSLISKPKYPEYADKQYMTNLLDDYNKAKEYFSRYDLENKKKDADYKQSKIKDYLYRKDKGEKIDIKNLPKPITPGYIYGCSAEERDRKFIDIIRKYTNHRKKVQENLQNSSNSLKIQHELSKLDRTIQYLEKLKDDKWTPAPEIFELDNLSKETYKIDFQVCKNNTLDHKGKVKFNISIFLKGKNLYTKNIILILEKGYREDWSWNFNINDWENFDEQNDSFIMVVQDEPEYGGNRQVLDIKKIRKEKTMNINLAIKTEFAPKKASINFDLTQIKPRLSQNSTENSNRCDIDIKRYYGHFPGEELKIK